MTDLVQKINELVATTGADQLRQDKIINKLLPADAESLHSAALQIHAGSTSLMTGYLSQDTQAAYKSGQAAGALCPFVIKDAEFQLVTPNPNTAINAGERGVIELYINGANVDQFDLGAVFNPATEAVQTWTPANSTAGKITITSVALYNQFWQKANVRLNIAPSDLRKGYNTITLKHVGSGLNQASADFEVWNDTAINPPTVSVPSLAVHSKVSKWLSGVEYVGLGSVLKTSCTGTGLYDNTYAADPLTITGLSGAPTTVIASTDSAVTGVSNPPSVGNVLNVVDKLLTLSVPNQCSADARLTITPKRPSGTGAAQQSPSQNLMVNTFGSRSTDTIEYFDDEDYRLPINGWDDNSKTAAKTGNWNSQAALPAGEAQLGIVTTNDNGIVSTGNFKRYFLSGSTAKSSIQLTFAGTVGTFGQVGSGDINVEIKLPGQTGWMDAVRPYAGNSEALVNDGAGCMASISGNTINATFGTFSNFGSNYRCLVRVSVRNPASKPTQITTNW